MVAEVREIRERRAVEIYIMLDRLISLTKVRHDKVIID